MIVDVHTHCLQPDHVSAASRRADVRAGYAPMQPLPFERYAEAMRAVDRPSSSGCAPWRAAC